MPWIDAVLLLAHGAAIAAVVLVFRAALVRSLNTAPSLIAAPKPSPAATAPPDATGSRPPPESAERGYEEIVAELAELDRRHREGEITTEEHGRRRPPLLRAARRARRSG